MRIVDTYGINGGGQIFSVELAEDRFLDVKVCPGDGPTYVMQNEDGATVYSDKAYSDRALDFTYPGFEYDEKAVLKLVKETLKEFGSDCMRDDGSFPLPSALKGFREDLLCGLANIRGITYEMGWKGWMSTFNSHLARELLQVPRGKMLVAIESTQDCRDAEFRPVMVRNPDGSFKGMQDYFRIVCVNEMARLGEEFCLVDNRVFDNQADARLAVKENQSLVLVKYEELKRVAIDYLCGKPLQQEAQGQAVVADVLSSAEARTANEQRGDNDRGIGL